MFDLTSLTVDTGITQIQGLLGAGRGADAEAAARQLWQQYPQRGDVNEALALVLINTGKAGYALQFAEVAVKAEPLNASYLINLGRLYLRIEMIEEALPLLERAFKIDRKCYHAPWALGEFFYLVGSGEKAVKYLRQAIAACPADKRSDIEMHLANCLSSLGQVDEAESLFLQLAKTPQHRGATLASAANLRKHTVNSDMFMQIEQLLATGTASTFSQTALRLALGRIYANAGDHQAAYEQCRLSKLMVEAGHSLAQTKNTVDDLIDAFVPETLQEFRDFGDPSRLPVFVVGMPRSGTTLTEQIISAHPDCGGAGELRRVAWMWIAMKDSKGAGHALKRMREGGPNRCKELASGYVRMLRFMAPGAKRVVDKMPHNFNHIGFIALMFPGARIVHCMRNPADNFISAFQNHMKPSHSYSYSPADYAAYYKEYLRLMRHWHELLPGRIFDLRYEDLTANAEAKTRELLEFLKLPWNSRCLRFYERGTMVKTLSRHQVRNTVHRGSVEKWRNYAEQIRPLTDSLRAEAAAQEYDL